MNVHWKATRINPPLSRAESQYAQWTEQGLAYHKECRTSHLTPHYKPGLHYLAIPACKRILMPDLPQLCSLRHCWCWEPRNRPAVPVWSYAKMPSSRWSPAENARMFCVFMRPWTLQPEEATVDNPLLWNLGRMVNTEQKCAWLSCPAAIPEFSDAVKGSRNPGSVQANTKRRRLSQKSVPAEELKAGHKYCYATSWDIYIYTRTHCVKHSTAVHCQFAVSDYDVCF